MCQTQTIVCNLVHLWDLDRNRWFRQIARKLTVSRPTKLLRLCVTRIEGTDVTGVTASIELEQRKHIERQLKHLLHRQKRRLTQAEPQRVEPEALTEQQSDAASLASLRRVTRWHEAASPMQPVIDIFIVQLAFSIRMGQRGICWDKLHQHTGRRGRRHSMQLTALGPGQSSSFDVPQISPPGRPHALVQYFLPLQPQHVVLRKCGCRPVCK